MLVELGLVEQRCGAVSGALERRCDRQQRCLALRRGTPDSPWVADAPCLRRFGWPTDRSCRPDSCPHPMAPKIQAMIVEMRRVHPSWGRGPILSRLHRQGVDPLLRRTDRRGDEPRRPGIGLPQRRL